MENPAAKPPWPEQFSCPCCRSANTSAVIRTDNIATCVCNTCGTTFIVSTLKS